MAGVLSLIQSASAIFLTWVVLAVTFAGLGLLILRALGPPSLNTDRILGSFWLGFAGVIAVLQLWHFAFAVTWRSFALTLSLGLVGVFLNRSALRIWVSELHWGKRKILAVASLIFVGIWMADWATGPCTNFDSGMYHIGAVRWAVTYPIIPGLANLHDRLGFNNSGLLYAAMTGIGPWFGKSNHLANGLLVFVLMIQVVVSGFRLIWSNLAGMGPCLFDLLLVVPVVTVVVAGNISSLSTDVAPAAVLFVAGSGLHKWLTARGRSVEDDAYGLLLLAPLFCLAVCLKATAIIFSSVTLVVTAWLVWRGPSSAIKRQALWCAGTLSVLLCVPWMLRGVVLTGYPLFPSRIGGLPVEWRVPTELAEAQAAWVTVFARQSLAPGLAWLRPWLWTMMHGEKLFSFLFWVLLPSALALAASAVYLAAVRRGESNWKDTARGWGLALPILAGIAFWFLRLPDPRFGLHLFWMAAAMAVAQSVVALPPQSRIRWKLALLVSCAFLASLPIILQVPSGWIGHRYGFAKGLVHWGVLGPPRQGGLYAIPAAELYQFTTDFGLTVYVPVNDNRCWDAPLPCTPHPAPNLLLKTRFGRPEFITRGGWQQINWPNPKSDFLRWFRGQHASHQSR
jgi:hypothetical protein